MPYGPRPSASDGASGFGLSPGLRSSRFHSAPSSWEPVPRSQPGRGRCCGKSGLLAPGLPAAPPVGTSSVGFPTTTRALVPTSSPGTTLPGTATSIPSPTPIPVVADVRNGITWRSYESWTWDEPSLIFSMAPDGETAVVVSGESIDLVDPVTGEVKQSLPPFLIGRTAYAVAQRGSTILVGVEGEIERFDLRTNNPLTPLPIPGRELRLSPSGNLLAVRDKYITLLKSGNGETPDGTGRDQCKPAVRHFPERSHPRPGRRRRRRSVGSREGGLRRPPGGPR